ncbi:MAG: hypothetical protein WCA46_21365 [Actinocatenispora sp.]
MTVPGHLDVLDPVTGTRHPGVAIPDAAYWARDGSSWSTMPMPFFAASTDGRHVLFRQPDADHYVIADRFTGTRRTVDITKLTRGTPLSGVVNWSVLSFTGQQIVLSGSTTQGWDGWPGRHGRLVLDASGRHRLSASWVNLPRGTRLPGQFRYP